MPFEARFKESNKSIHTARDTLERSNNTAEHAVKFARVAAAYAIELAKGDVHATMQTAPRDDGSGPWKLFAAIASFGIALVLWLRTARVC
jgi:leucyl aminopeptidase